MATNPGPPALLPLWSLGKIGPSPWWDNIGKYVAYLHDEYLRIHEDLFLVDTNTVNQGLTWGKALHIVYA